MQKLAKRILKIAMFGVLTLAVRHDLLAQPQGHPHEPPHPEMLPAVEPQHSPLTIETLEQWALERNPTLAQAAAQIRISQGRALGAGLYPNPSAGYVAEQIGAEGTAGEFQGMFVEQEFVTAGKLRLSRAKYVSEAQQARLQWEAQRFRVLSSVRRAFYQALVTQQQVLVRKELVKNADEALTTTRGLVNVGQANRPDLLQAEVQKHRIDAELRAAERQCRGHWRALAAYAGISDLAPTPLAGRLEVSEADKLDGDTVLHELLQTTPELQVAWAEIERDRLALRREMVEPIPNILVRGETGYNFEARDAVAGISVGMRLPIFDKNQGSIMQARAELARAEAEVARIDLTLRRKFGERFGDYEAAGASRDASDFGNAQGPRSLRKLSGGVQESPGGLAPGTCCPAGVFSTDRRVFGSDSGATRRRSRDYRDVSGRRPGCSPHTGAARPPGIDATAAIKKLARLL